MQWHWWTGAVSFSFVAHFIHTYIRICVITNVRMNSSERSQVYCNAPHSNLHSFRCDAVNTLSERKKKTNKQKQFDF